MPSTTTQTTRALTWIAAVVAVAVIILFFAHTPPRHHAADMPNGYVGTAAKDFTLPLLDGGEVKLSALREHVVVLDFWADWCPPCVEELPHTTAITARYAKQGVLFYAINVTESADVVRAFLKKKGIATTVALAQGIDMTNAYGVNYLPQTVVIDKEGVIRNRDTIPPDEIEGVLPKWIENALK